MLNTKYKLYGFHITSNYWIFQHFLNKSYRIFRSGKYDPIHTLLRVVPTYFKFNSSITDTYSILRYTSQKILYSRVSCLDFFNDFHTLMHFWIVLQSLPIYIIRHSEHVYEITLYDVKQNIFNTIQKVKERMKLYDSNNFIL